MKLKSLFIIVMINLFIAVANFFWLSGFHPIASVVVSLIVAAVAVAVGTAVAAVGVAAAVAVAVAGLEEEVKA